MLTRASQLPGGVNGMEIGWSKNLFKLYRTPELGKGEENQPCPLKSFSVRLTVKVGRAA